MAGRHSIDSSLDEQPLETPNVQYLSEQCHHHYHHHHHHQRHSAQGLAEYHDEPPAYCSHEDGSYIVPDTSISRANFKLRPNNDNLSPVSASLLPQHQFPSPRYHQQLNYSPSNITPGIDNFSDSAIGGVAGIAYSVADQNARESGLHILHESQQSATCNQNLQEHAKNRFQSQSLLYNAMDQYEIREYASVRNSNSSRHSLHALDPKYISPNLRTELQIAQSTGVDASPDDRYPGNLGYTSFTGQNLDFGAVDPHDIVDDGDDGLEYRLGRHGNSNHKKVIRGTHSRQGSRYAHKTAANVAMEYTTLHNGASRTGCGQGIEKSDWLTEQSSNTKRWRWLAIVVVILLVASGVVCGVLFGVVLKKKNNSDDKSALTAGEGTSDLDINSPEIMKLLNNKNLHKVFPGVDYTPLNSQYPDCLKNPPLQNNVTQDIAVLSQLTNTIRLYGTDCNQTEMAVYAIKQLKLEDTMKIWMGVWQDSNSTTNDRQLSQMWNVLDKYGQDLFAGVVIANEILFREEMTVTELSNLLSSVRTNMTSKGIKDFPVATSDLGTVWDETLAQASDYVMANIHPFFGGVNAKDSASWTSKFWETNVGKAFKSDKMRNIISETGWPTQGGMDCGTDSTQTDCPEASVAGISQLNQFMDDWVCQALENGTQYFWFEAFDEPWKIKYNTMGKEWEDHWGLMDVNRNLKSGIKIPDCGGNTV